MLVQLYRLFYTPITHLGPYRRLFELRAEPELLATLLKVEHAVRLLVPRISEVPMMFSQVLPPRHQLVFLPPDGGGYVATTSEASPGRVWPQDLCRIVASPAGFTVVPAEVDPEPALCLHQALLPDLDVPLALDADGFIWSADPATEPGAAAVSDIPHRRHTGGAPELWLRGLAVPF